MWMPRKLQWEPQQMDSFGLIYLPRDPGSPFENGFMEPKFLSFWRWLGPPQTIILWQGDWIPRAWSTIYFLQIYDAKMHLKYRI